MFRQLARSALARHGLLPLGAAVLVALTTACSDGSVGPSALDQQGTPAAAASDAAAAITVMTQNLYPGANLDLVIGALASPDPSDDVPALQLAIQTLQRSDFPSRAAAIADAIARTRPHAVGLQEVATIDLDLNFGTPIVLSLHFLPILQEALTERGLHYTVAAQHDNFVVAPLPGISFADADVLLVDADRVTIESGSGHAFTYNLGVVAPGVDLERGWVTATVTIDGARYVLASAHPESGQQPGLAQLRAAQIGELAASLPTTSPALVLGDLNDIPGSPMYQALTGAGFTDVWAALRPGVSGETCCHADDLSDKVARFNQRIDYVFARGFGKDGAGLQGSITLFGDQPSEHVAGPFGSIWPSDHAGLVASLH
jgi:endonuclease/exonuclease/phosphatase (EEP) superfamily protein YafD